MKGMLDMKKMLLLLLICASVLSAKSEEAATETTIVGWNRAAKLFSENVKVGKFAVRSGEMGGNYASFALCFSPKNMGASDAEISLFWRANRSNSPVWRLEVRLYDSLDISKGGFLYWRSKNQSKANTDWQKIDIQLSTMKSHKKVDPKKIRQIFFILYRVGAAPKGQVHKTEFFIDGLTINGEQQGSVLISPQRPFAFRRMGTKKIKVKLNAEKKLTAGKAVVTVAGKKKSYDIAELRPGQDTILSFDFDSTLRPGKYPCKIEINDNSGKNLASRTVELYIAPRSTPHKIPVVMWGHANLQEVKKRGFTHSFITLSDNKSVFAAKKILNTDNVPHYQRASKMLDQALIDDFGVAGYIGSGRYLCHETQRQFQRVGHSGEKLKKHRNACALFLEAKKFSYNTAASVAKTYGKFPAFELAMAESETRDGAELCFHEHDKAAYKAYSGKEIPSAIGTKKGVNYKNIINFPANHIINDNHPVLQYLKWYWQKGDGWNGLYSETHRGLQSGNRSIGSWMDPAIRAPSVSGAGGEVDYISQWTYSYPDPIKIGKVVDELLAMASLSSRKDQKVMNTTQICWYRARTAPKRKSGQYPNIPLADWEKQHPDANLITIAPDHLSEAFWSQISRPIDGLMYHGWWNLANLDQKNRYMYRYTNSKTEKVLKRLIDTVVTPLGPSLKQIPDISSDVAFLQSFASEMFYNAGEWGWGWGWSNDAYQILRYAHMQPKVVYEESILRGDLKNVKVLVAVKCPVLTQSVAQKIIQFQNRGGIIVGDENLAPGITPDIVMSSYKKPKNSKIDALTLRKTGLQAKAKNLVKELRGTYFLYADTSNPDVILRVRRYKDCDYLFVINDKRTFGNYVGQYKKVMEKGLPTQALIKLRRKGFVYDLVTHQPVASKILKGKLNLQVKLAPGEGKLFMISKRQISKLKLTVPAKVKRNTSMPVLIKITDNKNRAIRGIVPVLVNIKDSKRNKAEFSGYYGLRNGKIRIIIDIAKNDEVGTWKITVKELASGKITSKNFIVEKEEG